jgi:predicted nuclease of predicted toxin-antitoxin system
MDFLADENFPLSSVRLLREAGHRVVSIIHEAPGSKDEDILRRAHTERLIILTFDRDYGELIYRYHALPPAGVVHFRFAPATPSEPAEILLNVIDRPGLSVTGKFTIVERGRVRQRSLHSSWARPFVNQ